MTKTEYRMTLAVSGAVLVAAAATAHVNRLLTQRRYEQAVASREALERQYAQALANHDRLTRQLSEEQGRSQELAKALADKNAELEEAVGRLTEEAQTIRALQVRLAAMTQQMDQLQGELALSLQQQGTGQARAAETGTVQLERIIVADAKTPGQEGRVLSVHSNWGFVVVDLGWNTVKIGDTVSILHGDQLLAKARIERVQEGVSAATLLPEWEHAQININDLVQVL